ncbi:MAG: outer membrane protein assembly factor, partial [Lepagella sp.]
MGIVRRYLLMSLVVIAAAVMTGCSSTRHVPPGRYLLDEVKIEVHDTTKTLTSKGMMSYVRQRPNNRTLHLVRMRLGIYNISGKDSTKWWNKWMRRLGEAPVIYD